MDEGEEDEDGYDEEEVGGETFDHGYDDDDYISAEADKSESWKDGMKQRAIGAYLQRSNAQSADLMDVIYGVSEAFTLFKHFYRYIYLSIFF